MSFDPIGFLNLDKLSLERQEMLRPEIYKDMTIFLLKKFTQSLTDEQLTDVEKVLPEVKTYEAVMEIINKYDSDFESKKLVMLEEYKNEFKLERLMGA